MDGLNTALEFLSTPSVRRATCQTDSSGGIQMNFYPRPPRGGRRIAIDCESVVHTISIHALREEGDIPVKRREIRRSVFLSTPSARRATFQ